jgi:hypothetical protein
MIGNSLTDLVGKRTGTAPRLSVQGRGALPCRAKCLCWYPPSQYLIPKGKGGESGVMYLTANGIGH